MKYGLISHAMRNRKMYSERRRYVIIIIIIIYIMYNVDQKYFLNCTLAIDSPFQTFAVGLLIIFID